MIITAGFGVLLAASEIPSVVLNNGIRMPSVLWGAGGPTQEKGPETVAAVTLAVGAGVGFPGIDNANHYHNQAAVAAGIAASGTARNSLWLQTKVEPCGHSIVRDGHCYEDTLAAFDQNLAQLNTSSVELTLIHSPPCVPNSAWADKQCVWDDEDIYPQNCNCAAAAPCAMMQQQWAALTLRYRQGKTKAIGVSNFCQDCLDCLAAANSSSSSSSSDSSSSFSEAPVVPAVNQLQFHVGSARLSTDADGLIRYNVARGIVVQAYSPLGGDAAGAVMGSGALKAIAAAHNKSAAQVALRWVLQLNRWGLALVTSTDREDYMRDDIAGVSAPWELSDAEMATLSALDVAPDDLTKTMCLYRKQQEQQQQQQQHKQQQQHEQQQ